MKKSLLVILIGIIILSGTAFCSKYKKVIPVMKDLIKGFEQFFTNIKMVDSGESLAKALDAHATIIKEVGPKMMGMIKKYPELNDEKNYPKELKPYQSKFKELDKKLGWVIPRISKYMNEDACKKSFDNWLEAMSLLDDRKEKEEKEKDG